MVSNVRFPLVVIVALMAPSFAGASPLQHGSTPGAQPGVVRTLSAMPSVPGSWHLSTGFSYGWEQNILVEGDSRHRAGGNFAIGYAPWRFLQIGLSAEGSIEGYEWPVPNSLVVGAIGDPKLSLRTGWDLGSGISLGALFDLWIPSSRGTFNVNGGAISPSIVAMFSVTPERVPIGVHLNVGYAHNRSINMLGNTQDLVPEHLLLSGATASMHHLNLALAIEYRIGPAGLFVDTFGDLTLDGGIEHSHMMVGFGSRFWLGPQDVVQLLIGLDLRVTPANIDANPATSTVYGMPPLLNVWIGITFRLPVRPEIRTVTEAGDDIEPRRDVETVEEVERGRISGTIRCGGASCGDTTRIRVAGTGASALAPDANSGSFTTAELAPGTYRVEATSQGFQPQSQQVEVVTGDAASLSLDLPLISSSDPTGIRGRITDFEGNIVANATIQITALGVEVQSDEEGNFQIEAESGRYEVIIRADGYRTQTTRIEVQPNVTVVMNVEMRSRR